MSTWTANELDEWFGGDVDEMSDRMQFEREDAAFSAYMEDHVDDEIVRCEADILSGVCLTPLPMNEDDNYENVRCPNERLHLVDGS